MRQWNSIVGTAFAATLAASAGAWAAAPVAMHGYSALAISASGDRIAAIETVDGAGKPVSAVVVRDAATGKEVARYDKYGACANCKIDFPSWSPDQKALAFIGSDAKGGTATVFVARDGKVSALTTIKGVANTARWSPDGKQLALLATIGAKKQTGAVEAGAPLVGEVGVEANEDEQRIALVPAAGGEIKLVSPGDTFVYEYDWTPDGKGFVVTSAKGNGDNNWWVATLGHIDAATGKLHIIAAPKMQMNMPHVSPDGSKVAFIGGLMSDFGSIGGDVYTVPLSGGEPVNVTPNYAGSFNGIAWRGNGLLASVLAGSQSAVVAIDPAARTARTLWNGPVTATASRDGRFVFSADGSAAASVHEDFEH
ncbi:MAG TPA: S9 family peptidase, partial [Telluria sp.]|nr:S9 family peptidase [Telluria sp.]